MILAFIYSTRIRDWKRDYLKAFLLYDEALSDQALADSLRDEAFKARDSLVRAHSQIIIRGLKKDNRFRSNK